MPRASCNPLIRRRATCNGSGTASRKKWGVRAQTLPTLDAMRHGGAGTWVPGSYDPDLHLYYFGTANPTPAFSGVTREGDNLYTSCIVALNVDTGKLAWYYQPSPHDTHDWDAAQTPIIVDGELQGKP